MNLYDNNDYLEDVSRVANEVLPWDKLRNKKIMITGATGLIGSFLIDVILKKNMADNLNCKIYALGRNKEKAAKRFSNYFNDDNLIFIPYDIKKPLIIENIETVDYILHLASNTHPYLYSTDPVGTIITNLIGLRNILDFSLNHNTTRVVFGSSNEVYGENRGDVELFDENYCGYINSNTLRACYPESKRCGEALCQAYISQYKTDVVIARLTRSYGPTMLSSDTKAVSQFINKALQNEDIVLKSEGTQFYSYTYVADAVCGLLYVMLNGECGQAYNIAHETGDITLRELATIIAEKVGKKVIFELPNDIEKKGFSKATKARLDGSKTMSLGWEPYYDIKNGIERTINILRTIYKN